MVWRGVGPLGEESVERPLKICFLFRGFVVLTGAKQAVLSEIPKASKKFFFKGIEIHTSVKRYIIKCSSV